MEVVFNIIQTTLESFDFAFCIVVNVLTYIIIRIINDRKNKAPYYGAAPREIKDITTWSKRLVLLLVVLIVSLIYWLIGIELRLVFNSAILAPVFWSWIMKPICKKFKLDYKQIDTFE